MPTLRSSRVVLGGEMRPATVRHESGVVVEIGSGTADEDYGDLVVMPGLVDSHVHVNEPGRADWEGFGSATKAAAAGGTTTIVDMPLNSIPPTVSVDALARKRETASGKISVDTAFWGGIVPGSAGEIGGMVEAGVSGFKAFMVDSGVEEFPPLELTELEAAMLIVAEAGVPLLLHAEDPALVFDFDRDPQSYEAYLASRPTDSEAFAVEVAGELAGRSGASVHILHVSSGEGAERIGASQWLTGETCPHYLVFCAEEIGAGATPFKCAPPIRDANHREALWAALDAGLLNMVVSDHSPAPADIKEIESGDFARAWGGIGSLQLRLQATWTAGSARGFGLERLAGWLSTNPAALAGLGRRKGAIAEGMDADFVVFDPDGSETIYGTDLFHRHPITPYEGMTLRGTVVKTVLRGQNVYSSGVVSGGTGLMLERYDD
ncbi:MAG: allantoinase AllB [Acidimicrobiia bacterium]